MTTRDIPVEVKWPQGREYFNQMSCGGSYIIIRVKIVNFDYFRTFSYRIRLLTLLRWWSSWISVQSKTNTIFVNYYIRKTPTNQQFQSNISETIFKISKDQTEYIALAVIQNFRM